MAEAAWERVVETLVAERGEALTRYAYLISGSADDAADLVQDALVKTFGRLRNGLSLVSAEAYVRRAILNGYLDNGRRRTRWRRISHLAAVPESQDSPAPATETRLDLQGELQRLSPRERACLVLRYYDDLKVDDIATTLEISAGAVKRYLSDGLAKMSIALGEPGRDAAACTSDSHTSDSHTSDSHTTVSHTTDSHTTDSHTTVSHEGVNHAQ